MEYESAVINGLIGDFGTVLCFAIDWFLFDISLNIWQLAGCGCVVFVVLSIFLGKIN